MSSLLEQAKAAAAKLADQTEDKGGSFEYEPPAAGPCIGRFVTYVEIGSQNQPPFAGKDKPPSPECIIEFQLLGKNHAKEIEVEEDGKKVKKVIYPILRLGRGPGSPLGGAVKNGMNMPGGSKSNHYKLLKAMDYGRGNTHMAFMLGEAFKLNIIHNEVETEVKGKKVKTVYANLRDENGVWQVSAPVVQKFNDMGDPEGEPQPINAPKATVEERMLLWDAPSVEQWNSIHIAGTYTKKEGEKEVEVSRNWLQATAKAATDFEGSALQTVIAELQGDLPDIPSDPDDLGLDGAPDGSEPTTGSPQQEDAPDAPENAPDEKPVAPADNSDPLADLGLT